MTIPDLDLKIKLYQCFFCKQYRNKPVTCWVRMVKSGKQEICPECAATFGLEKKDMFKREPV